MALSLPQINGQLGHEIISLPDKLMSISFDSIASSLANTSPADLGIGTLLLFTSLVWLASYQVGLFLNLRYSKIGWAKRVAYHAQTLLFCPVIGLVETFPAFWATIEYMAKKKEPEKVPVYDFYVIAK
jgi:hypothetical protein